MPKRIPIKEKSQFANYHPISNTSVFSRVLEKIIVYWTQGYFERNKLWHPSQHGFRENKSSNTHLLEAIKDFQNMADFGLKFDCLYINFNKAFDKVSVRL